MKRTVPINLRCETAGSATVQGAARNEATPAEVEERANVTVRARASRSLAATRLQRE